MRLLSLGEVLGLHRLVIEQARGRAGIRDLPGLESAVAQPSATFDGRDLYPTLDEKAAALGFSLIRNHPFTDGNKRVGHAAVEVMLLLNGHRLESDIDLAERVILSVASGEGTREELLHWIQTSCRVG
jgi:death on curing protein